MKNQRCAKLREQVIILFSIIMMIDFFTIFVATEFTTVVNTTSGPVQGEILTTINSVKYAAFKGIRYAKAPVGYLRFKPPVPVTPWNEILNAIVEGDDCTKMDYIMGVVKGSEDCLFINVFTPVTNLRSTPGNLKSVMVWIHGGGFTVKTSPGLIYRPDYIFEKDVVYVSFNYRLGALGFLGLGHPNATGNAGLKDQVLALKWVQANIKKFGGNPKNVTIFGQSAGGASVGYHVLSDASAGLFHGAISMSGVPMDPWALQTSEKTLSQAVRLAALLGTDSIDKKTLLQTFYSATAAEIVNATARIGRIVPPFAPTLEDECIATDVFMSKCSVIKYKTGNYSKVPQILGFMDQETILFFGAEVTFIEVVSYCIDYANRIGMDLPPGLDEIEDLINSGTIFFDQLNANTLSAVINETSDIFFIAQIDKVQKLLAVNNCKPVYYYHVSFHTNKSLHNILQNNTLQGAAHSDDLGFIFYVPIANYSADPTDLVTRTINRYTTMWTNFAKYGNPTPDWVDDKLNVKWPNSGPSGISLDIGIELTIGPRPIRPNVKLIQSFSEPFLETMNECDRMFDDLGLENCIF